MNRRDLLKSLEDKFDLSEPSVQRLVQGVLGYVTLPPLSNLNMYRRGAAVLHVHFGISFRAKCGVLEVEHSAVSQKLPLSQGERLCLGLAVNRDRAGGIYQAGGSGDKLTVLVKVFEATEDEQDVLVAPVGTLVRLASLDECLSLGTEPLDSTEETFPSFRIALNEAPTFLPPGVSFLDGEPRAGLVSLGDRADHDMIKCTSEVMYEVSQDDGNPRIRVFSKAKAVSPDALLALSILDADGLIGMAVSVAPCIALDVFHVLLRPLELEPPRISHGGRMHLGAG